ncbi:MAG: YbaK/EbsC family protein [Emergencia sp.]
MEEKERAIDEATEKMMRENEARLYEVFRRLGITDYKVYEHKAVYTIQEMEEEGLEMPGLNLKNLLLKDKKTGDYFLLILDEKRKMDEKHFREVAGWKKVRFATSEELMEVLGLIPGSVTPFGLINDREGRVSVVLCREITHAPDEEPVNFHPNRNTATLALSKKDFIRFLEDAGCPVFWEE